ncbi:glycosyltransferase family 4 protein [Rhodoferax sp.]|uniref:glycosyltransferase family 4 protein n=1 Tax=Rhodoferax sp. TaxID=50421 RepID=UPI002722AEAB|nr:glycosyltransferase family 4 protein [Rhodoferax sp.]MDO9198370.1 glycosyltransferase family 4 protein [Rhodoferax sp.]
MRIAVISRVFSRSGGGAESYSVALVQQLSSRHEIHVFAQESNQPVAGVTYHRVFCLSRKPRWVNQLLFAIATWMQTRSGFDVVHSHENTWHGQIQTIHVRPLRHNLFFARSGMRRFVQWAKVALSPRLVTYMLLEGARFKASPARKVVATSESLRRECEQAYPDSQGAVSVITPGTHCPQHLPTRLQARQQLRLPRAGRLVLFVANDYARKGLDALLQAMTHLPAEIRLVVVGNPKSAPKYRQKVEQMGLGGRIHFLGSLDDLSLAYCAADCLAHPTLEDSYAMVVLEAMAHGLPVVVSGPEHCGISRQLTQGSEALLLPDPRDAQRLAQLIGSVLGDTDLAAHLRSHGLKFAERHSWERAALQYEQLYLQAASRH